MPGYEATVAMEQAAHLRMRRVVVMREVDGRLFADIAKELGVTASRAQQIYRAGAKYVHDSETTYLLSALVKLLSQST